MPVPATARLVAYGSSSRTGRTRLESVPSTGAPAAVGGPPGHVGDRTSLLQGRYEHQIRIGYYHLPAQDDLVAVAGDDEAPDRSCNRVGHRSVPVGQMAAAAGGASGGRPPQPATTTGHWRSRKPPGAESSLLSPLAAPPRGAPPVCHVSQETSRPGCPEPVAEPDNGFRTSARTGIRLSGSTTLLDNRRF